MVEKYDKLIRNDIPSIIQDNDKIAITEKVTDEKYQKYLDKKLQEETTEYLEDKNKKELADILEVIYSLCELHDTTIEDIEDIRKSKKDEKGGFDEGIVLKKVE